MTTNETDTTLPEDLGARISIVIEIREGATIDINGMAMGFSEAARWLRAAIREERQDRNSKTARVVPVPTPEQTASIMSALSVGQHRYDAQSYEWAGRTIIATCEMYEPEAKRLIDEWLHLGLLKSYRARDKVTYKLRTFVRPV